MKTNLGRILREKGLSRLDLRYLAGTSPGLIIGIERYGYKPRPEAQERIAKALGVTVQEIWTEPAEGSRSEALIDRRADH